jgi:hypothetical protein
MPVERLDASHGALARGHGFVIKPSGAVWEHPHLTDAGNAKVKAIHDIRRYLSDHSDSPSAQVLSRLPATLSREETLQLSDLYSLDWETFELAIELLQDWRIDRYYAEQTNLLSVPVNAESPALMAAE